MSINEIIFTILEKIKQFKLEINKKSNNIINSRHIFIKDYENNILELNQLEIDKKYILYNDIISYKIKVEEKL